MESPLLQDMLLFLAVVDNKSFTGAADLFNISKSVVSKRISRLEKNLGVQLLFRSTRKLSLSEAGQELYERCSQIKAELDEIEQSITSTHVEPRGTLRVNCPTSFGYLHLVPAIADFMKAHPDIKVDLYLGALYEDLIDSGLDLAIRIGKLPDSSLMARQLTVRRMVVCASPEYLKTHNTPETPEDLYEHNCLTHHNSPTGNEWRFQKGGRELSIAIEGSFSASSSQTLESAAVSGLGVAMLPGYMLTSDMRQGKLVRLLEEYCPRNIGVYAVYPQTAHLPTKVRTFIDFIYERFQNEAYWN